MPQLPPVQPVRVPQVVSGTQLGNQHMRNAEKELLLLCQDARVPPDIKRRLHSVIGELRVVQKAQAAQGVHVPASWRSNTSTCTAELQAAFAQMVDGPGCANGVTTGRGLATVSRVSLDISSPFRSHSKAWSSACSMMRPTSALQQPNATFQAMNATMLQTLRYVDTVGDVDFDIANVRDYDNSVMRDMERLFLSVTCSVFANFAFCTTLGINTTRMVHFLRDMFQCYAAENAYHNALHAADALQMLSLFFREPAVGCLFTDMEVLCCLLSVLALDVAHPGVHNSSLALLQHPLVAVYGDIAPCEHAALLVFVHKLGQDSNNFVATDDASRTVNDMRVVRHVVSELVLATAPCRRNELLGKLRRMAAAQVVQQPHDTMSLLSAILSLASYSFALRSPRQCAAMGRRLVEELHAEHATLQRQNLPCVFDCIHDAADAVVVAVYCAVIVSPLADAVQAIVPSDLYDNLQHNVDCATAPFDEHSVSTSSQSQTSAMWAGGGTAFAMDTLRKIVTHASSLDRKASQYAILHASPPRTLAITGSVCGVECHAPNDTSSASSHAQMHSTSITHTPHLYTPRSSPTMPDSGLTGDDDCRTFVATCALAPPHAEHYFSFLRLYDKCEQEEQPTRVFCGQLVFLALQLNVQYIAPYARKLCDANTSSHDCQAVAEMILQNEEQPCSAESMVSRHQLDVAYGTKRRARDDSTDAFLLLLMHMYNARHAVCSSAANDCRTTPLDTALHGQVDVGDEEACVWGMHVPCSATALPSASQRRSPTRQPLDTDTSHVLANVQDNSTSLDSNDCASV